MDAKEEFLAICSASKFSELTDKEYRKIAGYFYHNKTQKLHSSRINHSYPEYKSLSIKQLVTLYQLEKDVNKKYKLSQEISFRYLTEHLIDNEIVYSDLIKSTQNEYTNTPFDAYSIQEILKLVYSPSFISLTDKQKRWFYQAVHNYICGQHGIDPIMVDYGISNNEKTQCSTEMSFIMNLVTKDVNIIIADSSLNQKTDVAYQKFGCFIPLLTLVDIIHETKHHLINAATTFPNAKEKIATIATTRFWLFPQECYDYSSYVYHSDPNELSAMAFSVTTIEDWVKKGILPNSIETQLILLDGASTAYAYYRENGDTWEEIEQTIRNYILQDSAFFASFHPSFADLEQDWNINELLDEYLLLLKKDYDHLRTVFLTNLKKVYLFFYEYCKSNPVFAKSLKKYVDVTHLTSQVKKNKSSGEITLRTKDVQDNDIEDILWGAFRALDHREKRKNNPNKHDIIKEYFEERNRIIKQRQQEREKEA